MSTKNARPKRLSHRELARVGISIIDAQRVWLRCLECGEVFMPTRGTNERLPGGYWKCPNSCNVR